MKLILIIDDDEQIRLSFGSALRLHGYEVIEADSGLSGLEMARQKLPDLILSDINMPGGDGQALLYHIRADPGLCSKQVVLMTGRPDLVSPRKGMEQGADDFLVKPVSLPALLSCLEARLSRADIHWRVEDRMVSKIRSTLTSTLPHEFFTPLTGIIGLSEILCTDSSGLSKAETDEIHKDIYQSALRLNRTLRNYLFILDIKPDAEKKQYPLTPLSSPALEKSLWTGVNAAIERHGRKEDITVLCADCTIMATASDVAIIVEELVDNAFKFSRSGTPVIVQLRTDGALLVIDSGRNMSARELEQIGIFQQFDRKKHEQQGLGLGLILVQKLAAQNGAHFEAKSVEQGLMVRVDFQVKDAAV